MQGEGKRRRELQFFTPIIIIISILIFHPTYLWYGGAKGEKGSDEGEREREREREGEMAYHAILPLGDGGGDGGKGGERLLLPSPPPTHSPFPLSLSDESVSTTFSSMVCLNGWGGWNFSE